MLVLSRYPEQWVTIKVPPSQEEQVIRVGVVEIAQGRARLGFSADREVIIIRDEILKEGGQFKKEVK